MLIPQFPSFRDLAIEDKAIFDKLFYDNSPLISEYTFTNIYSWKDAYGFKICMLDDSVILSSTAGNSVRFFEPIGKKDKKTLIKDVLKQKKGEFIRVHEATALLLENDETFCVELDRPNSDYLYRTDDLVQLKGGKYDGKRNLIRKFKSSYGYEYIKLTNDNARDIIDFETDWCVIKDCDSVDSLSNERKALRQMVENFSGFGLTGAAIKVNGRICAAAIGERLNGDTIVLHIMKAQPDMQGLYQTINNEFLSKEARDFKYVNMEQDLGVEGLRKSKESYHPWQMIKKYTARIKGQDM